MNDPFNLERFRVAQNPEMNEVLAELRAGRKTGHWMWFVFPQLKGLGQSSLAEKYGITSLGEASAYLQHPILGRRLLECTKLVNEVEGRSANEIFGSVDRLKFRSCMTLFAQVSTGTSPFTAALDKYFDGQPDQRTLEMLRT